MAKTNEARDLSTATEQQKAWIKLLRRSKGATRLQLQEATGSAFAPDWWHLSRLGSNFGFDAYVEKPEGSNVQVYQFVEAGKAPTAFPWKQAAARKQREAAMPIKTERKTARR